jgi:hypothetical protein
MRKMSFTIAVIEWVGNLIRDIALKWLVLS